jgi:hypothetical protein
MFQVTEVKHEEEEGKKKSSKNPRLNCNSFVLSLER